MLAPTCRAQEAAQLEARSATHKARWTSEHLVKLEQCALVCSICLCGAR